ncbi:hypothetical protein Patl1_13934 [Pistacia atlantica]|uniref:Uncharacterized protein n=1 Tax=Pistacia atlantica TaxID=434234 RepID=A0ACC1AVI0_9ROSI|nr:hypothetical protein Patl1_13934 [Pistacia atlantica]
MSQFITAMGYDDDPSSPQWVTTTIRKLSQFFFAFFLTDSVIKILDTLYRERDYARFFVLETIARVPYFAFISVLHLYESFGWWRKADYLKVHFAESWNEMHRLLIMEEACPVTYGRQPVVSSKIHILFAVDKAGATVLSQEANKGLYMNCGCFTGSSKHRKGDDVRQAYRGIDGEDFVKE